MAVIELEVPEAVLVESLYFVELCVFGFEGLLCLFTFTG